MQEKRNTGFQNIIKAALSRRSFLKTGTSFGLASFVTSNAILQQSSAVNRLNEIISNTVANNTDDTITLPDDYQWSPVISWGDPLFSEAKAFDENSRTINQAYAFGDNNDGMSLFEIDGKSVLIVNNEYINTDKMFPDGVNKQQEIEAAKAAFGVSVFEIEKTKSGWKPVVDGKLNRRITMQTPMEIRGPARGDPLLRTSIDPYGIESLGTWSNCGNGETPWGTYLTCEENFNYSFNSSDRKRKLSKLQQRYRITADDGGIDFYKFDQRFDIAKEPNEPNRMGYVVEIDPSDPLSTPIKRTALGRFMHENAELVISKEGYVVVYMGDDARGEFLYKFVSSNKFNVNDKKANKHLLDDGTLYVAKFSEANERLTGKGTWIELTHGKNGLTANNGFASQADICIKTRIAGSIVGATTMDRPEWVAAHPNKAEVCCSLTNNKNRNRKPNAGGDITPLNGPNPREHNLYGQIVRWQPNEGDHASNYFNWDLFVLAGNPTLHSDLRSGSDNITADNMFNSPDGLSYDTQGRLWIQTDGVFSNKGQYVGMCNNQMLVADTRSGEIKRFLVGPRGAEITGLTWSKDKKTLFIGIQHPGAGKSQSNFPDGGDKLARSTVVAIEHKLGMRFI